MTRKRGKVAGGGGASPAMQAAAAAAEARGMALEEAVNRWALLFYAHQALQAFRAGRSHDFRQLRDVINAMLARPLALEQQVLLQLRIIQLLSRIEEDWTIDTKTEQTPLECALVLLDKMKKEVNIDVNVIEDIRTKIKEAAVIASVKNKEYALASRILKKHMSKDPNTQKMRLLLQSIIRERNFLHPTIWNFSYKAFQQDVLLLLESFLDDSEPLLLVMAKKNLAEKTEARLSPAEAAAGQEMMVTETVEEPSPVALAAASAWSVGSSSETMVESGVAEGAADERREDRPAPLQESSEGTEGPAPAVGATQSKGVAASAGAASARVIASEPAGEASGVAGPAAVTDPSTSAAPKDLGRGLPKKPASYGLSTLREAFRALFEAPAPDEAFTELDETDWVCPVASSVPAGLGATHQREEESEEMEQDEASSPQMSSWDSSDATTISGMVRRDQAEGSRDPSLGHAASEMPRESSGVRPPKPRSPAPTAVPPFLRLPRMRLNSPSHNEEKEVWSDEEELFIDLRSEGNSSMDTSTSGTKRKRWTVEESGWITAGVRKFGEGNWKAIFQSYPFKDRTPVMIKDRWRTMKKLGFD
ncbi:telomeric repeat-binding factor 2 [Varanus komodoensis]|uniref:telomeric repeat-binding factor 2 n=1 Tax=Varanus komodoensis TaxID=61221 RepID=UPI001CF7EA2A|nr:telomeric repeat-binding factor 2 [Varanus komodoensis]